MKIIPSKRIEKLSSAIFTEMANRKKDLIKKGIDIIDLGIGSPDRPPDPELIKELIEAVKKPEVYGYPSFQGNDQFKQAIADWYQFRFGVQIDPSHGEVLVLMGSQDGLAHLAQGFVDDGDIVLVPDPGYPIYSGSVHLAGGTLYPMPLLQENDFLPDFSNIPKEVLQKAKLMILNYPSNPVSAVAPIDFFQEVVALAKQYDIIVAHDMAYSELSFNGYRPHSFLEAEGAKEVGIEFNSLSKSFNLAGVRVGYVVGNAEIINPLMMIKSNIDFGVFEAVQILATKALQRDIQSPNQSYKVYQERRDVLVDGLNQLGWKMDKPKATMFVWAPIPKGWTSYRFAIELLDKTGVVVIPGDAFGIHGEGYVRIGLVQEIKRLKEAIQRIEASGIF
ncbi:LL-diaminopimelate aminotransferase [Tepidibacillus infernus]|uniref:LL-diaminopimelate aminotransferase n=1 Tax=Tepidibacillus infernus TaxID=1806172 RepID=UPI003B6F6BC5